MSEEGETVHRRSWSRNLETAEYAEDRVAIIEDSIDAVERTESGTHVNLVTHGEGGHPEEYLFPALAERFGDAVDAEFVERCGCGGYVTRVHV
jgi:putative CGCGG family rSAM target protein